MTKLSVVVMAHPNRKQWVPNLQNRLGGCDVIWDEKNSRWDTGRRALLAHDTDATHHLIVQDDAVLSKNFLNTCRAMIKHSADFPIALYMGASSAGYRRRAVAAQSKGNPWFLAAGPRWGVAVIIPIAHIPGMVEWCDADNTTEAYDGKMTRYYERVLKKSCLYPIPSLVDHREVDENPSLIEGRDANRTAFIYDGKSAASGDWSRSPDAKNRNVKAGFINLLNGQKRLVNIFGPQYKVLKNSEDWSAL